VRAAPAVLRAIDATRFARKHTGLAEASGLPCAMALRLIRVRPGDRLSCHHHLQKLSPSHDLTPAPGRQAHTISPYAGDHARQSQPSRPPLPAPRLRRWPTPLWWDRMAGVMAVIWGRQEAEYFSREDWTGGITLILFRNFVAARKPPACPSRLSYATFAAPAEKYSCSAWSILVLALATASGPPADPSTEKKVRSCSPIVPRMAFK
jgi:hypothetical protein